MCDAPPESQIMIADLAILRFAGLAAPSAIPVAAALARLAPRSSAHRPREDGAAVDRIMVGSEISHVVTKAGEGKRPRAFCPVPGRLAIERHPP